MTATKAASGKQIVSVLLSCVLCLAGATACGPDSTENDSRGPITFSSLADLTRDHQIKKAVERWNEAHPDEHVTHVEQSESADYQRAQLVTMAQGTGECYDVHSLDVVWTAEFARGGYAVPLGEDESKKYGVEKSKFLPAAWETGGYAGRQWAVPFLANAPLLYYRKDVVDAADLHALTSLDAMIRLIEKIGERRRAAGDPNEIGGFAGQFRQYEGLTVNVLEVIRASGGDLISDDRGAVVEPARVREALRRLATGLKPNEWISDKALNYGEQGSLEAFMNKELLFMRNWPYAYRIVTADDSPVRGKVGVVPLPWSPVSGGHNLVVSPCSKHRATAWSFISFLAVNPGVQSRLFQDGGYPAVLAAVYEGRRDEFTQAVRSSLKAARPRPNSPYYSAVSRTIQDVVYDVLTDKKTPDWAVEILERDLPTALRGG
jgi:multiple sugar transport system substrate-binding protein